MPHCFAYGWKPKAIAAVQAKGEKISFHKSPEDKLVRKAWIAKIKREKFVISKNSRACSLHFYKRIASEIS